MSAADRIKKICDDSGCPRDAHHVVEVLSDDVVSLCDAVPASAADDAHRALIKTVRSGSAAVPGTRVYVKLDAMYEILALVPPVTPAATH